MFNNGFPVTYPQLQPPQGMTPPTIHADIVQVGSEQEAWSYPVAAGATQMMIARDDSAIFVKSAFPNSQPTLEIYRREAQKAHAGPSDYVTREELTEILKGLNEPKEAVK